MRKPKLILLALGLTLCASMLEARGARGDFAGPGGRGDVGPGGRGDFAGPGGRGDFAGPGGRGDFAGPGGRGDFAGPGGRGDFVGARNEVGPVDDPVKAINQNVTDDYYGNTYYIDRDPYLPYVNSQTGCVRMVCDPSKTKCSQVNVCELYNNYNNY